MNACVPRGTCLCVDIFGQFKLFFRRIVDYITASVRYCPNTYKFSLEIPAIFNIILSIDYEYVLQGYLLNYRDKLNNWGRNSLIRGIFAFGC